ncbi:hypothetical protein N9D31_02085 [Oligoflexaceae bacterium]|nr:hypothetical protein [Oligoflexaceae bacterium]
MKILLAAVLLFVSSLSFADQPVSRLYRWSGKILEPIGNINSLLVEPGRKKCRLVGTSIIKKYECSIRDAVLGLGKNNDSYTTIDLTALNVYYYSNWGNPEYEYRFTGKVDETGGDIPHGTKVSIAIRYLKSWVKQGEPFTSVATLKILGYGISRFSKGYQYPPEQED